MRGPPVKQLVMMVVVCSGLAAAVEPTPAPRVVVQPLAASIPLPGAANVALLTTLAGMAIELPSTFEVEDALAALPAKTCAEDTACLAGLARATKSDWAMAVAFAQRDGKGVVSAKVVAADGTLARAVETLELEAIPATEEAWAEAFRTVTARLALESLGKSAPVVVATPPRPEVKKPEPVVVVERPVAAPSARTPVAVIAGLIAVGAGGAAAALGLTNLQEANALDGAMRAGLLPGAAVDRAVALDERTAVATGLGIGAGVAAAVAIGALLMKDAPVQMAPVAGPGGAGLTLSGRFQ